MDDGVDVEVIIGIHMSSLVEILIMKWRNGCGITLVSKLSCSCDENDQHPIVVQIDFISQLLEMKNKKNNTNHY